MMRDAALISALDESQFSSKEYRHHLATHNVIVSMSRKSTYWHHTVTEHFFSINLAAIVEESTRGRTGHR